MDSPRTRTPHAPISADQLPVGRALLREQPALRTQFDMGLVRFVVLDSNRLARDCARTQAGRTHLRELIDTGSLIGFVPERVLCEVPRALAEDFAPRSSAPQLADMLEHWKELSALLTIVPDCELSLMAERQQHDQLRSRDRDDLDFIVLARALGAKVFTADRDLLDIYPDETIADLADLATLKQYGRDLAVAQVMPMSALTFTTMTGVALVQMGRSLVSAMRGRAGWFVIGALLLIAVVLLRNERAQTLARRGSIKARKAFAVGFEIVGEAATFAKTHGEAASARIPDIDDVFGPAPAAAQAAYGLLLAGADGGRDSLLALVQEVVGATTAQELRIAVAEHPRLCETASGYRLVLDGSA